jgi:hypothetical protein
MLGYLFGVHMPLLRLGARPNPTTPRLAMNSDLLLAVSVSADPQYTGVVSLPLASLRR